MEIILKFHSRFPTSPLSGVSQQNLPDKTKTSTLDPDESGSLVAFARHIPGLLRMFDAFFSLTRLQCLDPLPERALLIMHEHNTTV
jgi:hypothetical protein